MTSPQQKKFQICLCFCALLQMKHLTVQCLGYDLCAALRLFKSCLQIRRMSIASLREVMRSGNMLLPSVTTAFMAIEELQRRGFSV